MTPTQLARTLSLGLRPLVDAIRNIPRSPNPEPVPEPTREMLVRHLSVVDLGRWILLPGRPFGDRLLRDEPSVVSQAGRLVGIRPGKIGGSGSGIVASRVLVLQQGGLTVEVPTNVLDPVHVAPREQS
jgi:hypothetical protein